MIYIAIIHEIRNQIQCAKASAPVHACVHARVRIVSRVPEVYHLHDNPFRVPASFVARLQFICSISSSFCFPQGLSVPPCPLHSNSLAQPFQISRELLGRILIRTNAREKKDFVGDLPATGATTATAAIFYKNQLLRPSMHDVIDNSPVGIHWIVQCTIEVLRLVRVRASFHPCSPSLDFCVVQSVHQTCCFYNQFDQVRVSPVQDQVCSARVELR